MNTIVDFDISIFLSNRLSLVMIIYNYIQTCAFFDILAITCFIFCTVSLYERIS